MFSTMMDAGMKEAATGRFKVEDICPETVGLVLEFIYTGKFFAKGNENVVSDDVVIELLYCADKYEIDGLKEQVVQYMKFRLSCSNAMKFAAALELYHGEPATVNEFYKFCTE